MVVEGERGGSKIEIEPSGSTFQSESEDAEGTSAFAMRKLYPSLLFSLASLA